MSRAAGIDLGTTFSAIAVVNETGRPEIIKNAEDESLTPSVICFTENEIIIGKEAKQLQSMGETNVVSFFKRGMGNTNWIFPAGDKIYTPTDLSSLLLRKMKEDAESVLKEKISHAVITVPAYFSDLQRRNTIEAGKKAGLEVLGIINEPTAAAIAYGLSKNEGVYLVYDLGGGTFDVSLVKIDSNNIEVLATAGNHELGGKNWDEAILRFILSQFKEEFGIDPVIDNFSINDLMVQAENAKKALSASMRTSIRISSNGKTGKYIITRETFQQITSNLMEMTTNLIDQVLSDANINWNNLSGTLLVGGSTRMPIVTEYIKEKSGKGPLTDINVDEAVALGAAIQADILSNSKKPGLPQSSNSFSLASAKTIIDVTSHGLGLIAISEDRSRYINSILIPRNHPIPFREMKQYQFNTRAKGQNDLEVFITQGESARPLDCSFLGKCRFLDIPHNPDGNAIVEVSYEYDRNNLVQVSATEKRTGSTLKYLIEEIKEDLGWLNESPEDSKGPMSVLIAIDLSGSMSGTPLTKAQEAADGFVNQMDLTRSSIGLIAFADQVQVQLGLCKDAEKIKDGIRSLNIGQVGGGNSAEPFTTTLELLEGKKGVNVLVLLTDGDWNSQTEAIRRAKVCHENNIEIIAIGFGGADHNFLRQVASSDSGALLTDLNNLSHSFDRVAQELSDRNTGLKLFGSETSGKNRIMDIFK
jgi:molecular chaperone DnaK (HSP70)